MDVIAADAAPHGVTTRYCRHQNVKFSSKYPFYRSNSSVLENTSQLKLKIDLLSLIHIQNDHNG